MDGTAEKPSREFGYASDFSNGIACVLADGGYGYIDQSGQFVVEPAYQYAFNFREGLAAVQSEKFSGYINAYTEASSDTALTDLALARIKESHPDFVFLYMVETDEKGGHDHGWMTPEYLDVISTAIGNVKRVLEACGDEYTVIVTADHGGHDRGHGSDAREDMTIPLFFFGKRFTPGKQLEGVSILDIAPTIADIMSVPKAPEWEGKSLAE